MTEALETTVTAAVASFRDPLYAGVQAGLPCPPPSTIAGMLAAAAGGWDQVPAYLKFGAWFSAASAGVDLETYHPLDARGRRTDPTPKNRAFLVGVTLILWFTDDLDLWERALRRPVWPLRLGRSQDLAAARVRRVSLEEGPGRQGLAITPAHLSSAGTLLRLPTVVSLNRARTRWGSYRYGADADTAPIPAGLVTGEGQAVPLLTGLHPQVLNGPTAP